MNVGLLGLGSPQWSLFFAQFMATVLDPIHGHCTFLTVLSSIHGHCTFLTVHFMVPVLYPIHGPCTLPNSWPPYLTQFMVSVLYPIHSQCTLPNSWPPYLTQFMVPVLYPIHSQCTLPNPWPPYLTQFYYPLQFNMPSFLHCIPGTPFFTYFMIYQFHPICVNPTVLQDYSPVHVFRGVHFNAKFNSYNFVLHISNWDL